MGRGTQKIALQGFAKVQIAEDGKIIGDSGWVKNDLTEYAFDEAVARNVIDDSGVRISAMALGEGSEAGTDDGTATMDGEIVGTSSDAVRQEYTGSIITTSDGDAITLQWIATFSSGDRATTYDIANIGLYSDTSGTGLFCAATYASTKVDTNQDVHATYQWNFGTAA